MNSNISNVSQKWILIVDDDDDFREMLKELIHVQLGDVARVVEAKNGIEATNKISQQKFHCIITDVEMPKKDGNQFIPIVRQNQFNDMTPVIIVSGTVGREVEERHPFTYFVGKPFDSDLLVTLIKDTIERGSTKTILSAKLLNMFTSSVTQILGSLSEAESVDVGIPQKKMNLKSVDAASVTIKAEVYVGKVLNTIGLVISPEGVSKLSKKIDCDHEDSMIFGKKLLTLSLKEFLSTNANTKLRKMWVGNKVKSESTGGGRCIYIPLTLSDIEVSVFAQVG